MKHTILLIFAATLAALPAGAEGPVNITPEMSAARVETLSGPVEITRVQDPEARIDDAWARIARPCPNFCIQPIQPAPGVTPIGELELIAMLQDPEARVIDGRVTRDYETGTIPGAISIPYLETVDRLGELGCEIDFDGWDCTAARQVALFCNGPWCGQSPTAIRRMVEAGFPVENIHYYRAGMQGWRMLGLTVTGN